MRCVFVRLFSIPVGFSPELRRANYLNPSGHCLRILRIMIPVRPQELAQQQYRIQLLSGRADDVAL